MRQIRLHFLILLILLSTGVQLFAQTWVERTPIPTSRWYPCSVVIDEKIYVIGGMGETSPYSSLTIVEVYDVPGDSCETMTPMTMSRWGAMAAVVDNKIYVIESDTVLRLGPRLPQGVETIARCLHPEVLTQE